MGAWGGDCVRKNKKFVRGYVEKIKKLKICSWVLPQQRHPALGPVGEGVAALGSVIKPTTPHLVNLVNTGNSTV